MPDSYIMLGETGDHRVYLSSYGRIHLHSEEESRETYLVHYERKEPPRFEGDLPRWEVEDLHPREFVREAEMYPPHYIRMHWDWSRLGYHVSEMGRGFLLYRAWGNYREAGTQKLMRTAVAWHFHGAYLWVEDDGVPGDVDRGPGRWEPVKDKAVHLALRSAGGARFVQQVSPKVGSPVYWSERQNTILHPSSYDYRIHGMKL